MIIERETNSGDLVERRLRSLADLDEGKDAPLARLVRFWFSLPRNHGVVPDIDHVGLMELARLGVLGWFHIVDVNEDNPASYRYNVFAMHGAGGYSGIRVSDIGSKALQRALERDFVIAKENRFPLFQGVNAQLTGQGLHSREYRRVTLPLSSGKDDITHLLIGVHFDET